MNGNQTSTGAGATERGFVYSSSDINPVIDGANAIKEIAGRTAIGTFSKVISGLTGNTAYHYKAYATNSAGTERVMEMQRVLLPPTRTNQRSDQSAE